MDGSGVEWFSPLSPLLPPPLGLYQRETQERSCNSCKNLAVSEGNDFVFAHLCTFTHFDSISFLYVWKHCSDATFSISFIQKRAKRKTSVNWTCDWEKALVLIITNVPNVNVGWEKFKCLCWRRTYLQDQPLWARLLCVWVTDEVCVCVCGTCAEHVCLGAVYIVNQCVYRSVCLNVLRVSSLY